MQYSPIMEFNYLIHVVITVGLIIFINIAQKHHRQERQKHLQSHDLNFENVIINIIYYQ